MAEIIQLSSRRPLGAALKSTTDMAMPLQVRRHTKRFKRKLGSPAMRACRTALLNDAGTVESCMRWLLEIACRDPDPRAIEAFIDDDWEHFPEWAVFKSRKDIDAVMAFLQAFLDEYRKRFPADLGIVR